MGHQKPWDKRARTVKPAQGDPFITETTGGATWALRALIAAGSDGLRPTDGAEGRFARHIDTLRSLGIEIEELPSDGEGGRVGFRLSCNVEPLVGR